MRKIMFWGAGDEYVMNTHEYVVHAIISFNRHHTLADHRTATQGQENLLSTIRGSTIWDLKSKSCAPQFAFYHSGFYYSGGHWDWPKGGCGQGGADYDDIVLSPSYEGDAPEDRARPANTST